MTSLLRKVVVGSAATALAVIGLGGIGTVSAHADSGNKVWICKYVSTPGVGEVLSHGNPIKSIGNGQGYKPYDFFVDAQGKSVVAGYDRGPSTKPTVAGCDYALWMATQISEGNF